MYTTRGFLIPITLQITQSRIRGQGGAEHTWDGGKAYTGLNWTGNPKL